MYILHLCSLIRITDIAVGDRMFLGMQDFDFFPKTNQILPKFTKFIQFIQIYPNFTQIYSTFTQICLKMLLGDTAASPASPAPTPLITGDSRYIF